MQDAIGPSYRILSELGGGGMSRVFVAEEVQVERKVVVKVLPPETSAAVNIERFEREIRMAARLQHPHVVPFLTTGGRGDLLYYIMPYIEGESLRAKLAREGELPIPEAVRILRDVADALAMAHKQGIVHRDIKPDNILLSGRHALVTDFGVAKAVQQSSGSGNLTSLGVALGTPAYMSPEQATADPHTDHRADIYALGIVAYEMLCGRQPFEAGSAQAIIAAHVTQQPQPVERFRANVPPALAALVMRCLEKKPADRPQSAEELVHALEGITVSGASTPGGMTPAGTAPYAAALPAPSPEHGHPVRVAVLFGLAAAVVLGVAWVLTVKVGLPSWVVPGVGVLLALGFPIMVATGLAERRRAKARTHLTHTPKPEAGVRGLLTWRKSLLGGGLAFGALALLAGGYMTMRVLGIGSVGTLMATGALESRSPLVLADFVNRTGDSTLGPSVTDAFRVDLSQSPVIRLLDASAVSQALQRMGRPANAPIDDATARELATREGAKAVITGEIGPVGKGFVLSTRIVATSDGHELVALRETAADENGVIPAIDRLSKRLRERVGESLRSLNNTEPLEQVTTASLDALKKYSQAVRLDDNGGDPALAAQLLQGRRRGGFELRDGMAQAVGGVGRRAGLPLSAGDGREPEGVRPPGPALSARAADGHRQLLHLERARPRQGDRRLQGGPGDRPDRADLPQQPRADVPGAGAVGGRRGDGPARRRGGPKLVLLWAPGVRARGRRAATPRPTRRSRCWTVSSPGSRARSRCRPCSVRRRATMPAPTASSAGSSRPAANRPISRWRPATA